jgi:hypothetical protein
LLTAVVPTVHQAAPRGAEKSASERRVGDRPGDFHVACLAPIKAAAYPRPVVTPLFARVDRRIADLMLARARRRWPLLRVVPRTCARQLILPAARLARQDVLRVVVLTASVAGALLLLILGF